MKVLFVNMALDARTGGGSASRTVQFARALSDLGATCAVATTGVPGPSADAMLHGVHVESLPATGGRFRVPYARFDSLDRAVSDADVVLLVNHWTVLNVLAWRAARRQQKPYVVCPSGALPESGRSLLLKRLYNRWGGRRLIRTAGAHVAVTPDERAHFAAYGVSPESVDVVPNGIPHVGPGDRARFLERFGISQGRVLLFMGRLAPIKGPDLLLEAFSRVADRLPHWSLVLAGPDDGQKARLERQRARSPAAERTHMVGFLDGPAKADALAAASLVVVPSRREAMSIVVLEAAAAGRPVLITDQCGLNEVQSSGGGWVVSPTAAALADGLIRAASVEDRLEEMGEAWHAYADMHFSWSAVGQRMIDVLDRAIAGARVP